MFPPFDLCDKAFGKMPSLHKCIFERRRDNKKNKKGLKMI